MSAIGSKILRIGPTDLSPRNPSVAVKLSHGRALGGAELTPGDLRGLFAASEELLWRNLHRPVKLDLGVLIVQAELIVAGCPLRVAVKRYQSRWWWKALLAPFRSARAPRAWRNGLALLAREVATARPIAAFDQRRPWFRRQSYLVVQWVEGSENLHLYLWRLAAKPEPQRTGQAHRCSEQIGRMLGRMHSQGILHGDLKASNLLVVENDRELATYLVDVDDVVLKARTSLSRRASDLARLAVSIGAHGWVSRTVVCRFLRAYQTQFAPGTDWKAVWRATAKKGERIARKKRRRKQVIW